MSSEIAPRERSANIPGFPQASSDDQLLALWLHGRSPGTQRQPMQTVLKEAIDRYRREKFLEEANRAFASLRSDPGAWREEQQEREIWGHTAGDGLEEE